MRNPGIWYVKVVVRLCSGHTLTSPAVRVEVQFPHIDTFRFNPVVTAAMDVAWSRTLTAARRGSRQEYGFWIYAYSRQGGNLDFSVGGIAPGASVWCGGRAYIVPGGANELITDMNNPLVGGRFVVAHFHTHPPMTFCDPNYYFRPGVGPSDGDRNWASKRMMPGLVRDFLPHWCRIHREYGLPGAHPIDAETRVCHFGPFRRATFLTL